MMGLRAVKKQGGFTALELLVVLIVTVAALGLGSQYLMSYADTQVNQAAADHNKTVADAATKYTKDNYAAILATATSSSPAVITVPMLKSTGYLTSSVTDQNPYGQTYEIRALQPVANKLETLIVTLGGETIPEMDLRRIAQVSGARGGYISSTNTAVATGSYGGWQMPLANYGTSPGAGHLATALFFDDGALVSDYLYRNAVAGHPEFNRMNTAIDMNGNNINNAGTVNATTLNATGDTYTGGWFRSQGDTGWYSQKWGGGWYMSDSNWIRSVNDKNVYTAGQMQAGTMRSNGRLSTGEYLQVDGVAVENQPCGARTVGLDANGLTLSCQSGVWKRAVKSPNMYRYVFTTSQSWTVPAGVTSAFVTMAGGGGSGLGWRFASQYITGHSGGFVFSSPVNLVAGETMSVVVGKGGVAFGPVDGGGGVYVPPAGDDGYAGYPGGASQLISPSAGVLLECDGGSGATTYMTNAYNTGNVQVPGPQGSAWAFGSPFIGPTPSRPASGPYARDNGPGACGPNGYGSGNAGAYGYAPDPKTALASGIFRGALTPFGYGSGGDVNVSGCYITPTTAGTCVFTAPGRDGVVMIDVLY